MSKILVIEDEPMIAQDLTLILESEGFEVLGPFDNAIDVKAELVKDKPDLALVDINIKGDQDGVQIAATLLQEIPFLFITSIYDKSTLRRVQKVNPEAYVLKPFKEVEVLMNVKLALSKRQHSKQETSEEYLLIRDKGMTKPILVSEIDLISGEDNYTRIILETNTEFLLSQTLKSTLEKLPESLFVRVHKSYVVNKSKIEGISGKRLFLNGRSVPIGRAFKKSFLESLRVK